MSPAKPFDRKTNEGGEQVESTQKTKVPKKGAPQPLKPKKAESSKKPQKRTEDVVKLWWNEFRQYLREVGYELRKVIWPSRKETFGSTAVVLVIVILSSVFLGVVDALLSRLIRVFVG